MTRMHVFIIRAALGVFFGIIVTRLFFPQASTLFVVGVCVILVAMAYVTESLHGRKK